VHILPAHDAVPGAYLHQLGARLQRALPAGGAAALRVGPGAVQARAHAAVPALQVLCARRES